MRRRGDARSVVHRNLTQAAKHTTPSLAHSFQHPSIPDSELRQVPDNQEAFVDGGSEASLILELLELEHDKPGPEVCGR